jgi:pimeloyl-ACP methyl ester carboxylesterase
MAWPLPEVMVTGVKLAYDDAGSGDCVVLIHGHPFDRTLWQPQVAALCGDFRVVVPDLRGFGHSPVTQHLVTMRELAADIEELLESLGIERAALVGLSMGGLVTMELAASQPERYWAIGLVATTMEPPTPAEGAARRERAHAVERDGIQVLLELHAHRCVRPGLPTNREGARGCDDVRGSAGWSGSGLARSRGAAGLQNAARKSRHPRPGLRGLGRSMVGPGSDRRDHRPPQEP